MKNTIIRDLGEWFKTNERGWDDRGDRATYNAIDSKALVEIAGKSYPATIAAWDVGACDTTALSIVTGEDVWSERYDFQDFREMAGPLNDFITFPAAYSPAT